MHGRTGTYCQPSEPAQYSAPARGRSPAGSSPASNIGLDLHFLHARRLVHLRLEGPPRLTCDGETAPDELDLPD